jgi:hypothetical protein
MPDNAGKKHQMPEAQGNADGGMPAAANAFAAIAAFMLVLFTATAISGYYRDDRNNSTESVMAGYAASVHADAPLPRKHDLAGKPRPEVRDTQPGMAGGKASPGNAQDLAY